MPLLIKQIIKSLLKYKTSTALNLLSLVISFTGIIILSLYISYEKSFDSFHKNKEQLYRVETQTDGSWMSAKTSATICSQVPEVIAATPVWNYIYYITTPELQASNTKFEAEVLFADSAFFNMFSFPLLLGDEPNALNSPYSVVISEKLSAKLFSDQNPIGKKLMANNIEFTISGVMQNFPENSSIQADCVFAFSIYKKEQDYAYFDDWNEWSSSNFVQLAKGVNPAKVEEKILLVPEITEIVEDEYAIYEGSENFIKLRKVDKIRFFYDGSLDSYTNPVLLKVLMLLTVILAIAGAINFINFTTSQAPLRAKPISVTRIMGRNKFNSIAFIVYESVLISLIAIVISLVVYHLYYTSLQSMFNISGLSLEGRYHYIIYFILMAITFGIFAGLYPSFYITSAPISQSIKGKVHFSGKAKPLRNSLIVFQLVITIALIASSLVIEKQIQFWHNYDIGINKDHVVFFDTSSAIRKHSQSFAQELIKHADIDDYTYAQFTPGNVGMEWSQNLEGQYVIINCWPVDDKFLDFFGIDISDGRKFRRNSQMDINSFIINKKAAEQYNWKNPLGKQIRELDEKDSNSKNSGKIIGVAKNFNFSSLKENVKPMAFWLTDVRKNKMILRINPANYQKTIAHIEETAHQFDPTNQFEVSFLDEELATLYGDVERMARLIEIVSVWIVFLLMTGLLGLVIFTSRDKIKEIGIRKVNGAKISEILIMLNKDFIKWVAIAFVIACPIAFYAMSKWLESFAYKTELNWWIFALAGILALVIALITVSWQSWRAATRNPVDALRYE